MAKRKPIYIVFILCWVLVGCIVEGVTENDALVKQTLIPSNGMPVSTLTSTSPTLTPSVIEITPTSQASPLSVTETIEPTLSSITPFAKASLLEVVGWSPNSKWLVYRTFNQEEKAQIYTMMQGFADVPGTVYFLDTETAQTCAYPSSVIREPYRSPISWLSDGKVMVHEYDGIIREGTPCSNEWLIIDNNVEVDKLFSDPNLSPAGNYRASTAILERTDDPSGGILLRLVTTIENLKNGRVENTIEWQRWEEFGLGVVGEWVREDIFLIYQSFDKGPLLVQVSQNIIEVVPELFGQSLKVACEEEPCGVSMWAKASSIGDTGPYQILLYGVGRADNYPPIWLYHAENGQVEELPLRELWQPGFSPDGKWLILKNQNEEDTLWIRAVDEIGSDFRMFSVSGFRIHALSPDSEKIAFGIQNFGAENHISIFTFPGGAETVSKGIGNYAPLSLLWSPDSKFVSVLGSLGESEKALFVIPFP